MWQGWSPRCLSGHGQKCLSSQKSCASHNSHDSCPKVRYTCQKMSFFFLNELKKIGFLVEYCTLLPTFIFLLGVVVSLEKFLPVRFQRALYRPHSSVSYRLTSISILEIIHHVFCRAAPSDGGSKGNIGRGRKREGEREREIRSTYARGAGAADWTKGPPYQVKC